MSSTNFQRARRPEQKAQRRNAILTAAADLLEEGGLDAVTLSAVAKRVGLAKSNLYRYFESRESILLELLAEDMSCWLHELEIALKPLAGSDDSTKVGAAIAKTLAAQPRLCRLTAVVTTVLEQNVSLEAAAHYKRRVLTLANRTAKAVHSALPGLRRDSLAELNRYLLGLIAGLWPIANPAPVVCELLEQPEFKSFVVAFEETLGGAITALLIGLRATR